MIDLDAFQAFSRASQAAAASLGAMADAAGEAAWRLHVMRVRRELGDDAPPPSWDVERENFIRRFHRAEGTS